MNLGCLIRVEELVDNCLTNGLLSVSLNVFFLLSALTARDVLLYLSEKDIFSNLYSFRKSAESVIRFIRFFLLIGGFDFSCSLTFFPIN